MRNTFQIVRVYFRDGKSPRVIRRGLGIQAAIRHVSGREANSVTAKDWQTKVAREGHWYDIFQPEG